jgi:hypothetical protein
VLSLVERIMSFFRPRVQEIPPPLVDLNLPSRDDRLAEIASATEDIHHRERVLRMLLAKARVKGDFLGGDNK